MKIKYFFITAFCFLTILNFAQSPIGHGGKQLNFGISGNGSYVPIYVSFDFGVHPDITIAPQIGLDLDFDWLNISGRGDYHFNTLMEIPQNWDFYAGLTLGYVIRVGDNKEFDDDSFYFGGQVGGRWYWSDKWGLNLEFGGGNLYGHGRIGVSMKII